MKRLILVAGLAIGLAACGGDEQQASEDQMDSDDMATAEEHMDDMAEAAGDMMDEADDMMDDMADQPDTAMSMADMQAQFLTDYAQGSSTVISDTGLMYRVEREGDGASPGPLDTVEVHYEGRLVDGTVFDSSYERGETIEFPLNRVIPGWTEGLQYMQVGSKYQLVIPPELGYGSRGAGDVIPPDAVLIFDVELFNVTPAG